MANNSPSDDSDSATPENQVVSWINQLDFATAAKKLVLLRKIQETLFHQCPHVLPVYLDDILCFVADRSQDVKKCLVTFIEEISKIRIELLPRTINNIQMLLMDNAVPVQKRVIQAANTIYKNVFVWICTAPEQSDEMGTTWDVLNNIKLNILNMIDSENEGIRTNSIKFLEGIIILQTYRDENLEPKAGDYSLDDIPMMVDFIQKEKLEKESNQIFVLLLKFHNSQHISGVNLMACMSALCEVAKARPKFLPEVIVALNSLQSSLPATLSQSQTNSVKKHLKMQVLNMVRHPSTSDMIPQLLQMLSDFGMSSQEIAKIIPRGERKNKRLNDLRNGDSLSKRARIDSPQSNSQSSDKSDVSAYFEPQNEDRTEQVTEKTLLEGLDNIELVVKLVMATMKNLPENMPAYFKTLYEPISNAGIIVQRSSLAKLLLRAIKNENIESAAAMEISRSIQEGEEEEKLKLKSALDKLATSKLESKIESVLSKLIEDNMNEESARDKDVFSNFDINQKDKQICPPTPTIPKLMHRVKSIKLHEVTKPLSQNVKEKLIAGAVERVLKAERAAQDGGADVCRMKMLSSFAVSFGDQVRETIIQFILEDVASRIDLALSCMYEEYCFIQGFSRKIVSSSNTSKIDEKSYQNYNNLLCSLIMDIAELSDPAQEILRENLFRRVYLEAPLITTDAIIYLKQTCLEEDKTTMGLNLLKDLISYQPTKATKYITALLPLTINKNATVREAAIERVVHLYKQQNESLRKAIDKHANLHLGFIALSDPPKDLLELDFDRQMNSAVWDDDLYKICIQLYLAILPYNDESLSELCRIYIAIGADGKRCVLRLLETPVRQLGSNNPTLLTLIEECPKGAETLVTRIIQILTEKASPSPELVSRVRDLYSKKVSDVRFLIPVINGLTKTEILSALPKLIKLNPIVLREAFNKILTPHVNETENHNQPVSPAELLVALHLIDTSKVELKFIIKATSLCFAEKHAYTPEVLGDVLNELVEQPQLPVLLMRSVLQALSLHPMRMSSLVINILHRLISKQVWEQKVVWEGVLKCCQRLLPQSLTVLIMLPAEPLRQALTSCHDLHMALVHGLPNLPSLPEHVSNVLSEFTSAIDSITTIESISKSDSIMDMAALNKPLPPGMD